MRTIGINTTQNVIIDYQLAGLKDRFFASFIDLLVWLTVSWFFVVFVNFTIDIEEGFNGMIFSYFLPLSFFLFYHLFSEVMWEGQSLGKKAIGIKVVRLDGQEAGLSDYLLRSVFLLIDMIFSVGVVGAMLISSSSKTQRLGDMTANTTVIRLSPDLNFRLEDILKINSIENYEPQYPEVRSLSEKDMLLVKQVLNRQRTHSNKAHKDVVDQLVSKLCQELDIKLATQDKIGFLKTLLRDYIVLTR